MPQSSQIWIEECNSYFRFSFPLAFDLSLLVGTPERVRAVAAALDRQPSWGHQIAGYLNVTESRIQESGARRENTECRKQEKKGQRDKG
jgi:hypothetical protein